MGTNFYIKTTDEMSEQRNKEFHIGKRSAAGWYCWDCDITLCKDGNGPMDYKTIKDFGENTKGVHFSKSGWYEDCPTCGHKKSKESLEEDTAGRELGFNNEKPKRKTGVKTCSSFLWGMNPAKVFSMRNERTIVDEYGRDYTFDEFLSVLDECPIWTFDLGVDFS